MGLEFNARVCSARSEQQTRMVQLNVVLRYALPRCQSWSPHSALTLCIARVVAVDPSNCARKHEPSSYFPDAKLDGNTTALTFSFATCGYLDKFSTSTTGAATELQVAAARSPQGKLRIGFPGDSASGYTIVGLKNFPDGSPKVLPYQGE